MNFTTPIIYKMACSSMAELPTLNRRVVGSNPTGPTITLDRNERYQSNKFTKGKTCIAFAVKNICMSKLKLSGKELRAIGYPEGPVISIAMNTMEKNFKHLSKEDALEILSSILQSPNQYAHDG